MDDEASETSKMLLAYGALLIGGGLVRMLWVPGPIPFTAVVIGIILCFLSEIVEIR